MHFPEAAQRRPRVGVHSGIGAVHARRQRAGKSREYAARCGAEVRFVEAELVRQATRGGQRVAHANLVGDPRPVVVFPETVVLNPEIGAVGGLPAEGCPEGGDVAAVDVVIDAVDGVAVGVGLAVGDVFNVSVTVELETAQSQPGRLSEWNVQHGFRPCVVVVAEFEIQEPLRCLEVGQRGNEVDGAARGVTAVQRALRAAQNLDPLHVEKLDGIEVGADGNLVHVRGHAGLSRAADHQPPDAADAEARIAEVGGREADARRIQLQVGRVDDLPVLQHAASQGGHRDGHVLDALRRALCGDDDFLDGVALLLGQNQGWSADAHGNYGSRQRAPANRICACHNYPLS